MYSCHGILSQPCIMYTPYLFWFDMRSLSTDDPVKVLSHPQFIIFRIFTSEKWITRDSQIPGCGFKSDQIPINVFHTFFHTIWAKKSQILDNPISPEHIVVDDLMFLFVFRIIYTNLTSESTIFGKICSNFQKLDKIQIS